MKDRKYFFTGASGFIGFHFHKTLSEDQMINLDLKEPSFKYGSSFIQGDIRIKKDIKRVLTQNDCDVIINLAAEHKDFGITDDEYFKTNEFGTQLLCDAASEFGIKKFVFYSSVAVYGANTVPSHEDLPPNPNNPYGASKLAAEKVLEKWASEDNSREVLIIRPTVVYGERNVANMYRLIEQIKNGKYFHIGKGDNVKSIAYVKNLVDATLFLMDKMKPGVQIYNYSDNPQLSSRQIAEVINQALGKKSSPFTLPYWLVYLMGIPFDIMIKLTGKDLPISTNRVKKFCTQTYHKPKKVLNHGFTPKYTNNQGLQNMVRWIEEINNK